MNYKISDIEKLTGLKSSDLRNWEKRFGFPRPVRSPKGQRLFNEQELFALQKVSELKNLGARPQTLKEVYFSFLTKDLPEKFGLSFNDSNDQHFPLLDQLLQFNLKAANFTLNQYLNTRPMYSIAEEVFLPILRIVGDKWAKGEIPCSQEHFISNFIRSKLQSALYLPDTNPVKDACLLATLEGEQHEGALLTLGLYLKAAKKNVVYLGSSLPIKSIEKIAKKVKPQFICLSFIYKKLDDKILWQLNNLQIPICIGGAQVEKNISKIHLPPNIFVIREFHNFSQLAFEISIQSKRLRGDNLCSKRSKTILSC